MERCTNCRQLLTPDELEDITLIRVFHGHDYRYCKDCWHAWSDDIFGEGRNIVDHHLRARKNLYNEE